MMRPYFLLLALVLQICTGCYSFTATTLPSHIRTVVIHDIDNRTLDPVLAMRLREGVIKLFKRNAGSVRIVNEEGDADFTMTLLGYSNRPENYTSSSNVETYRVTLRVNVDFYDNVKKKVIYEGRGLSAEGVYDVQKNESEENHGQARAIEKLQELIVANALAKW